MGAYAVIRTGGKQHRVSEGDEIVVERLDGDAGSAVRFEEVLMTAQDGDIAVGAPLVAGAAVTGEIIEQRKGPKLLIFKKKRRQNYRRTKGHRQLETVVRITSLSGDAAPKKKAKAEPKTEAPAADAEPLFTQTADAPRDDLKKISGVGPALEKKLHALGVYTFAQIAAFTPDDIAKVDERLNFKGRIERDDWLGQAAALARGEEPGSADDAAEKE